MLFIFGKYKCLHTGHGNEDAQYTKGGTVLNTTLNEKDLGVAISADMKVSERCRIVAAKGIQTLGLIRRNIMYSVFCDGKPTKSLLRFLIYDQNFFDIVLSLSSSPSILPM